jgi:hypothetical protein
MFHDIMYKQKIHRRTYFDYEIATVMSVAHGVTCKIY